MKIVIFIFAVSLFTTTDAASCNTGNPCDLDAGYYSKKNGYDCLDAAGTVFCTCPNGDIKINTRCRVCDNVCPSGVPCLEGPTCGDFYACLCPDPSTGGLVPTTDRTCDLSKPSTCPKPGTTPGVIPGSTACLNGGVSAGGKCHCPIGYGGLVCELKNNVDLCKNFICKNKGACAVQTPYGQYEPVCLCPYGTSGDYCELIGTLGFCSRDSCMNNGACEEKVIESTRFAYCRCPPGYSGPKCQTAPTITCTGAAKFVDTNMIDQGKYFECVPNGPGSTSYRLEQKSCPKGLRFDSTLQACISIS